MSSAMRYLEAARETLDYIECTQGEAIERASALCAEAIARGGLVHLFGSGHSRISVEEMFPRYGSFPGFHPIVELSLTYHHPVVGSNGQRQAMFLERVEGFGEVILSNFTFGPHDIFMVFSSGGTNAVGIDVALGARKRGMPVIAVTSVRHAEAVPARHSAGKKLHEVADLVIDNGAPPGDAMVKVPGLAEPVGPGSTIGSCAVVNAVKCRVAELLTEKGKPPIVLTSAYFIGEEEATRQIERCYEDYRRRTRRL
ncbi:MAG: SIS domain-containing protein [Armatimonadetes bacterium]|nr:SIS domain-containing protein [Armatimonadota bacterium]